MINIINMSEYLKPQKPSRLNTLYITSYLMPFDNGVNGGYKHVLSLGAQSWMGFHTDEGLRRIIEIFDLHPELIRVRVAYDIENCEVYDYKCPEIIEDIGFKSFSELPQRCDSFIGLSNGSYVTCYVHKDGDHVTIYRPNPNYKDVYKPLPKEVMKKFRQIYG